MAQQGSKQTYSCDVCGQTFNSEREQREHNAKEHQGRQGATGQSQGQQRRDMPNR